MIYKKKDQIQNFQILQEHFLWRVINVKEITSRKKKFKNCQSCAYYSFKEINVNFLCFIPTSFIKTC